MDNGYTTSYIDRAYSPVNNGHSDYYSRSNYYSSNEDNTDAFDTLTYSNGNTTTKDNTTSHLLQSAPLYSINETYINTKMTKSASTDSLEAQCDINEYPNYSFTPERTKGNISNIQILVLINYFHRHNNICNSLF